MPTCIILCFGITDNRLSVSSLTQLSKASRSDSLVKELYLENAQLMRALQVTEGRQKMAEENSRKLQLSAALSTLS